MSYSKIALMELMNAVNCIKSESDLNEFKDLLARFFASKAQKAIDALWNDGVINIDTIEEWGKEHMRIWHVPVPRHTQTLTSLAKNDYA